MMVLLGLILHAFLNIVAVSRIDIVFSFGIIADIFGVLAGIYIADFATSFVHWMGDADIAWKNRFLKRFHELSAEHHQHPKDFLKKNYFQIKGNIAFFYAPALIAACILAPYAAISPLVLMLLTVSNLMLVTHSIHKWSHEKHPTGIVYFLQHHGLIISPQYHIRHHTPPYTSNFSGLNGWADRIFSAIFLRNKPASASLSGKRPHGDRQRMLVRTPGNAA